MSAQNQQLKWIELTDFLPGLTTVGGDILEPGTGASQMDDVLASPMGGLIASMRAVSFSITGIANPTTAVLRGLFIRGGVGGGGGNLDRFIWILDGSNLKIYRWDERIPATSWALISTIALNQAGVNHVVADVFVNSAGLEFVMFNVYQSNNGNDGVYSIDRADSAVVNRLAIPCTCVVVQDDKIIAANGAQIRWSASQLVSSWPAENNLDIQISRQGSLIVTMNAFAPSDVLLGNQFAPWNLLQGEIEQPLVRGMSDSRVPGQIQRTPLTTGGVAFISPDSGCYLTTDGNQFVDIGAQLDPTTWSATACPFGYSDNMLMVASGRGHIYDERTGSWHRTSAFTANTSVAQGDPNTHEIFVASKTGSVLTMWTFDTSFADRAGTWTWKSVPLRSEGGRQIAIREVQLYAESFDSNATVAVTVGGVTHSITIASASKEHLSYRFLARDETLDVKVVSTAGTEATNQAPSIEVIRIGYTTGHLLTP